MIYVSTIFVSYQSEGESVIKKISVLLVIPLWAAFATSAVSETAEQLFSAEGTNGKFVSSAIKRDYLRSLVDPSVVNTPGTSV